MTPDHSPFANRQSPVVIVGGGLSGLIASTMAATSGLPVVLLERAAALGGRAASKDKQGFIFNLGPHALYRGGHLRTTLGTLGVEVQGALPPTNGGFALLAGRRHTLPVGFASLLTTSVLTLHGKFELARFQSRLAGIDPTPLQREALGPWLESHVADAGVRQLLLMLVRVTTFTNDPEHQSAGAAIEQLQLAFRGSVLYLNGGWQTIVEGLRGAALAAGVRIISGAQAVGVEQSAARHVDAVRLADGSATRASAVIVTGSPGVVDRLIGTRFASELAPPVRVATLDVGLRSLPKPAATVAFGVDTPLYFSVHSAVASLAPPGGAMIHVTKYLRPGETAGRDVELELEGLMDLMQPRWRDRLAFKQYLPALIVTNAEATAAHGGTVGRPSSAAAAFDNVWIAGDWVGPRGQLSDAAAASAADAVAGLRAFTSSTKPALSRASAASAAGSGRMPCVGAAS